VDASGLHGEVVHVDRFGNAITNLRRDALGEPDSLRVCRVHVKGATISTFVRTYGEAECGVPVCLIGSGGHLEIAVNWGRAAQLLGLFPGDRVTFEKCSTP
jgi:S-adenosylmethionine hydrolase